MENPRQEYEERLLIYYELAQKNPETYQPYVASILENLGFLNYTQGGTEEARREYGETLQIYRSLAKNLEKFSANAARLTERLEHFPR
jgi:nephrocystin-3